MFFAEQHSVAAQAQQNRRLILPLMLRTVGQALFVSSIVSFAPLRINWRSARAMRSGRRAARWPWSKHRLSLSTIDQHSSSDPHSRFPLGSELNLIGLSESQFATTSGTATQLRLNCDSTATQLQSKICLRELGSTWLSMVCTYLPLSPPSSPLSLPSSPPLLGYRYIAVIDTLFYLRHTMYL